MTELYSDNILILINKWKQECCEKIIEHDNLARRFNFKHTFYGFVPLILPLFMTFTSQTIEDNEINKLVSGGGFVVIGVCNAILKFLDLKSNAIKHEQASYQYNCVVNFIEATMSRNIDYRLPAETVLAVIRTELKNLENYTPSTEVYCLCDRLCPVQKIV